MESTTEVAAKMNKDNTKILAMLVLGGGSMIFGLLPGVFTRANRRQHPLKISNLLCFGAGVLLATSLVHMLPEVREKLTTYPELFFCAGFFLVYVADEIVHLICGEAIRHDHHGHQVQRVRISNREVSQSTSYGSVSSETRPLLGDNSGHENKTCNDTDPNHHCSTDSQTDSNQSEVIRQVEDRADAEANARICHTNHTEPCEQSSAGHAGLLFALCLHSILEGLAIGVQDSSTKVLLLLSAVSCHKFVVGFCLGVELCNTPGSTFRNHFLAILVFSLGSVMGIGFGMGIIDVQDVADSSALQILQALAAGTLLYVTVCEVLPREKARWHNSSLKYAGISQCIFVMIGFTLMTLLSVSLQE